MKPEIHEEIERTKPRAFIESAARLEVNERDPRVIGIPHDHGDGEEREHGEQDIEPGRAEFPPESLGQRKK
jgi:hypothetical protein